ncbi:DedA family protein [Bacillus niameyensis]|uniref:DedA family protein n=1 Tax=Bacillus niameyensis TaxID=1522308 RepID=UPI000783D984|nr:DedA family protein [Bacillus niameyensis]
MVQQFLQWLSAMGLPGLFLTMFLEGSSLPFPGVVFVFSYGYLLSPGYVNTSFIAAGMGVSYTLASLIPYFLGRKVERLIPKKMEKGLQKGISLFKTYGIWSIAFSRPFGVGNYISYVAGMSKVNLFKYSILTFIGIYPWSYVMILLGDYFKGNYEAFKEYFQAYSIYGYGLLSIGLVIFILIYYRKFKKRNLLSEIEEGGKGK